MNKKAQLVLKALVMIILTIFIFVPTIMFVAKLLGPTQAEDSFADFVKEVNTFVEKGKAGETKTKTLIMDEGTVILGFEKNKPVEYGYTYSYYSGLSYHIYSYPKESCNGKDCLCLCSDIFGLKANEGTPDVRKQILCKKIICKELKETTFVGGTKKLGVQTATVSIKGDEATVSKSNIFDLKSGFMFERTSESKIIPFNTDLRRTPLYLEKINNKLIICPQSPCNTYYGETKPVKLPECTSNCIFDKPNVCAAKCDGINGCSFSSAASKKACDGQKYGSLVNLDDKHKVTCCEGNTELSLPIQTKPLPTMVPGSGCFLENMEVKMADGSSKRIKEVKAGDQIQSYDLKNKKIVPGKVLKQLVHNDHENYLILNGKIEVTPEHRFLINGLWMEIGKAKLGDLLFTETSRWVPLLSLENKTEVVTVYNLEIEIHHTFFVEEYLVHNAK